jgi:tetratricopeptide (TPR) repeat protein
MQELANRLIAHARGYRTESTTDSANRLTAAPVVDMRLRVGLWPILSDDAPETAMGLMTLLGLLLERWREVAVYRLFVDVDGEPDDYEWELSDSQFGVDDWQLDGLDENVAVWGSLDRSAAAGTWSLQLQIENDLAEGDDVEVLTYDAAALSDLVALLPQIARDIAGMIGAIELKGVTPAYAPTPRDTAALQGLLKRAFEWEKQLFLSLWGADWPAEQLNADLQTLIDAGQALGDDLGAWVVSSLAARAMLPTAEDVSEALIPSAERIVEAFPDSPIPSIALSLALMRASHEDEAYSLLEASVEDHPESAETRLALAGLYQAGQRIQEMIRVVQGAIEDGIATKTLYQTYAELLMELHRSVLLVPRFLLIDVPDRRLGYMIDEAIAAYEKVLSETPDDLVTQQRRLLLIIESGDTDLWDDFERLVRADTTGEYVRSVVDSFQMIEDVSEGLKFLENAVTRHPERYDLRVNFAVALLADEQPDKASVQLEQAEELTDDDAAIADIERLFLAANDPAFEVRMGEITEAIDARKEISDEDIDYLEAAVEDAPSFVEGYLLLAKAYMGQNEDSNALETLLDGQKFNPDDPEITEMLARLLWRSGESDLTFDYLNKGLAANPDNVALLALTGLYLFEDDQEDEAKEFLTRAESISPQNAVLREVKRNIAGMMEED